MTENSKDQILKNAARLLQFTTQVCTDRGKPNLITIFKDDIIRLTVEDKKLCSLLRLFNTFSEFEPQILIHLNEFLPIELRYVLGGQKIDLSPLLKEHMSTCPELHMAPEEDQYDVFLTALNQIVSNQVAESFKILLSRFVKGQPETRIEVLQFIVKSAELLGDFPELLGGLLEYLNKTWYNYAVETMKFASVQQIAMAYGVFSDQVPSLELFRRIVEQVRLQKLSEQQLKWRQGLILTIRNQTKQMVEMCNSLLVQLKNNTAKPQPTFTQSQEQLKKIDGRNRKKPDNVQMSQIAKPVVYQHFQQPQISSELKQQLMEIKSIVDPNEETADPIYENILPHLAEYFHSQVQFLQVLDQKVPINFNYVMDVYNSQDDKQLLIATVNCLNSSARSMIWQQTALQQLSTQCKANVHYLELDDAIQLHRAIIFKNRSDYILKQMDKGVTLKILLPLLTTCYNNIILEAHSQFLKEKVISQRHLIENVVFFNNKSDENYNSEQYKPILIFDENRIQQEYVLLDGNGQVCKTITQQQFSLFEKKLNNMALFQKSKFNRKFPNDEEKSNYKFKHPIRCKLIDKDDCLNRQYVNAFANGHENTSALGLNPYNFTTFEQDVERQFDNFEDCNQLEEHLMRYDIFINNLKATQTLLTQFVSFNDQPLQLPLNCQFLLKAVITDEYFQQLQLYPQIAAPMVLERVNRYLLEITKYRELVVGPVFTKRVSQLYFSQLDFQTRNLVENDRKLLQCKSFATELQSKKTTANILQKSCLRPIDSEKFQYPWDNESNSLPVSFLEKQAGFGQNIEFYQKLVQKAQIGGCSTCYHTADAKIEFETEEQEESVKAQVRLFNEKANVYAKAFQLQQMQGLQLNKQQTKAHYCTDVHHVMIPVNQIIEDKEAHQFIKSLVCGDDQQKSSLFDSLLQLITSGKKTIVDPSIYVFLRFLIIVLARTSCLHNISNLHQTTTNFKRSIFSKVQFQEGKELNSYSQSLLKKALYSEIDEIYQQDPDKQKARDTDWEQMQQLLCSQKINSEYELLAVFGPSAYLGSDFKQVIRTQKRLFEDLFDGYERFIGVINGQESLQQLMQSQCFAGFLVWLQMEQGVNLIIESPQKYFQPLEAETLFRQASVVFNQQAMVIELIEDFLCFSEIDF